MIDENGYAKTIRRIDSPSFYPVRHESWDAGNVYVGKYSMLNTLDEVYLGLLEDFLCWLEYGITSYCDYISREMSEEELLYNINQHID